MKEDNPAWNYFMGDNQQRDKDYFVCAFTQSSSIRFEQERLSGIPALLYHLIVLV